MADDGLIADGGLSYLDVNLRAERQVNVHARTELDETEVLVDVAILALGGISHDTSCYGSGHLAHQYFLCVGCLDDDGRAFVLAAGFRQPGLMEVAVVMAHHLDVAIDGEPVGMDIGDTHEDGNHEPSVVEVLVLLHFLDDHHLAVGRRDHRVLRFAVEQADGTAEEVDDDGTEYRRDGANDVERPKISVTQQEEQQAVDHGIRTQSEYERIGSFAMQAYLLESLDSGHVVYASVGRDWKADE